MSDVKISNLPASTTPLAGSEVLPIVQSGVTKKVSVDNLTAGKAISTAGVTDTSLTASKPVFTDASKKLTSSGTLATDQGGTGLTAFTANRIFYASSTSTIAQSAGLTFNGTNFATTGTSSASSFTSTGGRSSFSAASEAFAVGAKYVSTGGTVFFGAVDGTSTPDAQISNANGSSLIICKHSRVVQFPGYGAGTLTTDASGNITAVSDENNKRNIRPFTRGLAEIVALANANNGVILYGYTSESGLDQTKDDYVGWSAQEVQKIIPEAVGKMADTLDFDGKVVEKGCLTLNPIAITAAMNNAISELNDLLNKQAQTIAIMQTKIDSLTQNK